ncbi:MAG: hypothetical protein GOMPHAMPRED_001001 [Gomphillus americanus]|uniref:RRM domain-containing protein n=1 Tax=Gomphillus americanus TaxID=1940652 RepID=A0A8H3F170_9LECA|nr:MAG: hypothetical protein GOMPHAMPRED_001001 [Gomphillus americanus]
MANATMASRNGPPTNSGRSDPPSPSLYLTNLTDKLRKPDLRLSLYTLFSTYGPVLDVIAMPGAKMRGQAHVVFRDTQTSTQAMRALQGFDFFGKDMKIQYARTRSGIFQKLEGIAPSKITSADATADARQSLFTAPSSSAVESKAPPSNLPAKPEAPKTNGTEVTEDAPKGMKRAREDESDEEAPMEEDSDVPMEASSDED